MRLGSTGKSSVKIKMWMPNVLNIIMITALWVHSYTYVGLYGSGYFY